MKRKTSKSDRLSDYANRNSQVDDNEIDEENRRETKKVIVDKDGKTKEVDIYDRAEKKKDPEKLKAIFSSTLEQSIIPSNISNHYIP